MDVNTIQQKIFQPVLDEIITFLIQYRDELDVYNGSQWSGVAALFSMLVLITIIYGALSLRQVSKKNRLERCLIIFNELKEIEQDREDLVFNRLYDMRSFEDRSNSEKKLQGIINSFNRITYYVENGHIDQRFVFEISCVNIIQCWYRLIPYVDYMTKKIGVAYAMRLQRLDRMAKNYFDSTPRYHNQTIKINDPFSDDVIVYRTNYKTGWKRVLQSIIWTRMDITKRYTSWTLDNIVYRNEKR